MSPKSGDLRLDLLLQWLRGIEEKVLKRTLTPPDPIDDSPADSEPSRSRSRSRDFRGDEQVDTSSHSLLQHSMIRRTTDTVDDRSFYAGVYAFSRCCQGFL